MNSDVPQHLGDELLGAEEDDIVEREPEGKDAKVVSQSTNAPKGNLIIGGSIYEIILNCGLHHHL